MLLTRAGAELDPEARIALYEEAGHMLVADAPAIFVHTATNSALVKPYVTGYSPDHARTATGRPWIEPTAHRPGAAGIDPPAAPPPRRIRWVPPACLPSASDTWRIASSTAFPMCSACIASATLVSTSWSLAVATPRSMPCSIVQCGLGTGPAGYPRQQCGLPDEPRGHRADPRWRDGFGITSEPPSFHRDIRINPL